jgi:hypothetical protein
MSRSTHCGPVLSRCAVCGAPSCSEAPSPKYDRLQRENERLRQQLAEQQRLFEEQKEQISDLQQVVPVLPSTCQHCGHELPQQMVEIQKVGSMHCHQVTELPTIQPFVIEYQCPKVLCPACGGTTRATLPPEAQGEFGPQLMGLDRLPDGGLTHALGVKPRATALS